MITALNYRLNTVSGWPIPQLSIVKGGSYLSASNNPIFMNSNHFCLSRSMCMQVWAHTENTHTHTHSQDIVLSVQFSSVAQSCRLEAHQASLSITTSLSSFRLMSIKSLMPSSHYPLSSPSPPAPNTSQNQSFPMSQLLMRWPKYWSFSFSISPSKEIPGLISYRMDWLDLLKVQGTLKSLLQHHSSKASILRHAAFFTVQLTSIHDHWKNHNLD